MRRLAHILAAAALATGPLPSTARAQPAQAAKPAGPNGISVFEPKVYDDRSLQLMLRAMGARLSALSGFDQTTLTSRLGSLQGASSSQMSASLSAMAVPMPGVTTEALNAQPTTTRTGVNSVVTAPTGRTDTDSMTTVRTVPSDTLKTTTTSPAVTPSSPALPSTAAVALPTTYGVSSVDALNEQMQLSSAIVGLQLLLQGPLGDELTPSGLGRRHVTLGFPISIETPPAYRNRVAEVAVSVCNGTPVREQVPPSLRNILPQEKTYNVASLTSRAFGFGAGAVISNVVNVGGSFLWGRQTYYLVRDQDTVAVRRSAPVADSSCPSVVDGAGKTHPNAPLTFAWQFRPVLNRPTVQQGMRQTFAQIALAPADVPPSGSYPISVTVRTCWRKYDRKAGIVGPEIKDSCQVQVAGGSSVPVIFPTTTFSNVTHVDRADGTLSTRVQGRFLPGTQVAIADAYLGEGSPGFENAGQYLAFTAPTQAVASRGARLVSPDGGVRAIEMQPDPAEVACWGTQVPPPLSIRPYSDALVEVTAPLWTCPDRDKDGVREPLSTPDHPLVVIVNGKAFGMSDAPFRTLTPAAATFLAPKSLVQGPVRATVRPLYRGPKLALAYAEQVYDQPAVASIVLLSAEDAGSTYALTGTRLSSVQMLEPDGVALKPLGPTMASFRLTAAQIKSTKQVVLQEPGRPAVLLALPAGAADAKAMAKLDKHDLVPRGSQAPFVITGSNLSQIVAVGYLGRQLPFSISEDGAAVTVVQLPPEAVAIPGNVRLQVLLSDGSVVDYTLTVGA